MNVLQSLTLTTSLLLLSGCASLWPFGTDVQPIEIKTEAVERTKLNLQEPTPLKPSELKWKVVTPDNIDKVWAEMKESGDDLVLFALTDNGYESLSITMAEIRNFIAQQKVIIVKYKEYYEPQPVAE